MSLCLPDICTPTQRSRDVVILALDQTSHVFLVHAPRRPSVRQIILNYSHLRCQVASYQTLEVFAYSHGTRISPQLIPQTRHFIRLLIQAWSSEIANKTNQHPYCIIRNVCPRVPCSDFPRRLQTWRGGLCNLATLPRNGCSLHLWVASILKLAESGKLKFVPCLGRQCAARRGTGYPWVEQTLLNNWHSSLSTYGSDVYHCKDILLINMSREVSWATEKWPGCWISCMKFV